MPRKIVPLLLVAALCAAWILSAPPRARLSAQPAGQKGQKKLPKLLTARPLEVGEEKDEMRRLMRLRYNVALQEVRERYHQLQGGQAKLETILDAFRRLLASGAAAAATGKDQLEFLEQYVDLTRHLANRAQATVRAGQMANADAAQAQYMLLDAEIQLLRVRRRLAGPAGVKIE